MEWHKTCSSPLLNESRVSRSQGTFYFTWVLPWSPFCKLVFQLRWHFSFVPCDAVRPHFESNQHHARPLAKKKVKLMVCELNNLHHANNCTLHERRSHPCMKPTRTSVVEDACYCRASPELFWEALPHPGGLNVKSTTETNWIGRIKQLIDCRMLFD